MRILTHNIDPNIVKEFHVTFLGFLIEAVTQTVHQDLEYLDPQVVISWKKDTIVPLACLLPNLISENDLQTLDNEWRLLDGRE